MKSMILTTYMQLNGCKTNHCLSSGVAIRVGANSEVELIEKKHRIEDALEAVNSAQQEGIVCGMTLFRISEAIDIEFDNEEQATSLGPRMPPVSIQHDGTERRTQPRGSKNYDG